MVYTDIIDIELTDAETEDLKRKGYERHALSIRNPKKTNRLVAKGDKEMYNILGVLGEGAFAKWMGFSQYRVLGYMPAGDAGYDFVMNTLNIDIKTVMQRNYRLLVFEPSDVADWYVMVWPKAQRWENTGNQWSIVGAIETSKFIHIMEPHWTGKGYSVPMASLTSMQGFLAQVMEAA